MTSLQTRSPKQPDTASPSFEHDSMLIGSMLIGDVLPAQREAEQIQGFIAKGANPLPRERHSIALKIEARSVAVRLALNFGLRSPLRSVADQMGKSVRNLHFQFKTKEAMFAFPPPEMADALVHLGAQAQTWDEFAATVHDLLEALDRNKTGRDLLYGLAVLHDRYPELEEADAYFAQELRSKIRSHPGINPRVLPWVGYLADGFKDAIRLWALDPDQPITIVSTHIASLLADIPEHLESSVQPLPYCHSDRLNRLDGLCVVRGEVELFIGD